MLQPQNYPAFQELGHCCRLIHPEFQELVNVAASKSSSIPGVRSLLEPYSYSSPLKGFLWFLDLCNFNVLVVLEVLHGIGQSV
jgi:hypothetical protein